MSDFTREELERLSSLAINASNRFNPNDTDSLCLKIQSMLDNYCEHKDTDMDCDGGISLVCTQCGYIVVDV